jgi:hypothetical protein|tara:strand:+ start:1017 stop:1274 length:258 start_codon:yes stop_codon:yes gene_type:complete
MRNTLKFIIPLLIWFGLLVIIGLSIDMRWGSPYGQFIPLLLLLLSFRGILKAQKVIVGIDEDKDKDAHPPTSEEELDSVVERGRD